MNQDIFVTNWVLDTVKRDYAQDIALVVSHTTLRMDETVDTISYFVPVTDRGRRFARTFILEGRGWDLWGIEWDRLERFADLEEYNITVLADAKILWARSEADAARFEALQVRQRKNLADPETARKQALIAYATAKGLFTQLLFSEGSDSRVFAGYVLDYLARAIAFHNHSYFRRSQAYQLEELQTMEQVPPAFTHFYPAVLSSGSNEERIRTCHFLIRLVRDFLAADAPQPHPEKNFQDLADWYAELSYTWQRLRHYAAQTDPIRVHMWGIMLQNELNEVCSDFGLPKMELMSEFDYNDLCPLIARADDLEAEMRQHITRGGGIIREYRSTEEFLHEV